MAGGGQPDNKNAEKWTEEVAQELGQSLVEWMKKEKTNIFFEEFLFIKNDLHPCTITYLKNKFMSFSKFIEKAKKIQEIKLIKWGTADKLNASMTKFVMINHHGYKSERQDIDHTTKGEKIIVIPPIVKSKQKKENE